MALHRTDQGGKERSGGGMKARDLFDSDQAFLDALDSAEENATSAFEMEFVDSLTKKAEIYGLDTFISENQLEIFKRIAGF